jgi:hypothetical protein
METSKAEYVFNRFLELNIQVNTSTNWQDAVFWANQIVLLFECSGYYSRCVEHILQIERDIDAKLIKLKIDKTK